MDMPRIVETKQKPLWWHDAGLTQTASGYGSKLTHPMMVRLEGEKIWRRVYVVCWSNSGTAYVIIKGKPHYFSDGDLPEENS